MPLRPTALACVALAAVTYGCPRSHAEPWQIGRVEVVEGPHLANPALGLTRDELANELRAAFRKAGRFVVAGESKKAGPRPYNCKLELAFTRETASEDDSGQQFAEVGVLMTLRRAGEMDRLQSTGAGLARFPAGDDGARRRGFREAMTKALAEAVEGQAVQLGSAEKTDTALIADLRSTDARVRDFAVRALAERKNAAAVPALIERLADDDREVAMHAVGALGAIGDPRAVPALIETTRNRDDAFVRSIVEVIGSIGGPDAQAWLFTIASGHPDADVREAAQEAQTRLEQRSAPRPPAAATPSESPARGPAQAPNP